MPWGPVKEHDGSGVPPEVVRRLTRMFFDDPMDCAPFASAEEVVDPSTWSPPVELSSWHWSKGYAKITRYQVHESRYANEILNVEKVPENV